MKPTYTESWLNCKELAKHMWRFFCIRDPTIDEMSKASYQAWSACNAVWYRLKPSEQAIVRMYHQAPKSTRQAAIEAYAKNNGLTVNYIMSVVYRVWKEAAIERGIADKEGDGRKI